MWAIEHVLEPCIHVVVYSNVCSYMHQNEWFQVRFFKREYKPSYGPGLKFANVHATRSYVY